jgi:hypothetical protein
MRPVWTPSSYQRLAPGSDCFTQWITIAAVTKLYASRPQKDFLTARLYVNSTALLASLRCEFWFVITRLGSAVRVTTLYDLLWPWSMQFGDGYYNWSNQSGLPNSRSVFRSANPFSIKYKLVSGQVSGRKLEEQKRSEDYLRTGWTQTYILSWNYGLNIAIFWVIAPCSLVEVYRRFRSVSCLHLWSL